MNTLTLRKRKNEDPSAFEAMVTKMNEEAEQNERTLARYFLEQRIDYLIKSSSVSSWDDAFRGGVLVTSFNPRNMLNDACFDEDVYNRVHLEMVHIKIKLEERGFVLKRDDNRYDISLKEGVSKAKVKESIKVHLDDYLYLCDDEEDEEAKPVIKKLKKCLKEL